MKKQLCNECNAFRVLYKLMKIGCNMSFPKNSLIMMSQNALDVHECFEFKAHAFGYD